MYFPTDFWLAMHSKSQQTYLISHEHNDSITMHAHPAHEHAHAHIMHKKHLFSTDTSISQQILSKGRIQRYHVIRTAYTVQIGIVLYTI